MSEREMLVPGVPKFREYVDCTNTLHKFENVLYEIPGGMGFWIRATEHVDGPGYQFKSAVESSPYIAYLGLYKKIQDALSQKHLVWQSDQPSMLNGKLAGTIRHDGVVIDGKLIGYDDFIGLLTTHEGFSIEVKITD